jgi:hypothetical protein
VVASAETMTLVPAPAESRGPVHTPAKRRGPSDATTALPSELKEEDRERGMTGVPTEVDEEDRDPGLESLDWNSSSGSRHGAGQLGIGTCRSDRGGASDPFLMPSGLRFPALRTRPATIGSSNAGGGDGEVEFLSISSPTLQRTKDRRAWRPRRAPSDGARCFPIMVEKEVRDAMAGL